LRPEDPPANWPTGRLLSTAARLAEQTWSRHLATLGLTPAGFVSLAVLGEKSMAQGDLAADTRVVDQTVSRTVERLERLGYVERRRDPADARRVLVTRTAAGAAACEAGLRPGVTKLSVLDEVEQPALFRRQLAQIVERLSHERSDAPDA
jgi:DNA-binding MarR family transcriptional regulator